MQLVKASHQALRTISTEVEHGEQVSDLIDEMMILMMSEKGIGLAANQVGITKRIIALNTRNIYTAIINPVITKKWAERVKSEEGCLTYPGLFVKRRRHKRITVTGFDVLWRPVEIKASGVDAFVIQHEIDHLNGITIGEKL